MKIKRLALFTYQFERRSTLNAIEPGISDGVFTTDLCRSPGTQISAQSGVILGNDPIAARVVDKKKCPLATNRRPCEALNFHAAREVQMLKSSCDAFVSPVPQKDRERRLQAARGLAEADDESFMRRSVCQRADAHISRR